MGKGWMGSGLREGSGFLEQGLSERICGQGKGESGLGEKRHQEGHSNQGWGAGGCGWVGRVA